VDREEDRKPREREREREEGGYIGNIDVGRFIAIARRRERDRGAREQRDGRRGWIEARG